jgi:nitrile hydratase beta subunit
MNGVHDMGGMHGMGPVPHEQNEPVFHEAWEARVYALTRAMRAHGRWNLDSDRYEIESLAPADYLRMSYYERWLASLVRRLVKTGIVTRAEVESGTAAAGAGRATAALLASMTPQFVSRHIPSARDAGVPPEFAVGDRVRARLMNPAGHTRLPRYARGKSGTIVRDHGVYAFPDTNAHGLGEKRQHVYSVRFAGSELWGPEASPRDFVHLDMWDDYLERA